MGEGGGAVSMKFKRILYKILVAGNFWVINFGEWLVQHSGNNSLKNSVTVLANNTNKKYYNEEG